MTTDAREPKREDGEETPTVEELQEPSTEKDPGEEPKAKKPHDPEPSHEAVGIGVIGGDLNDAEQSSSTG